MQLLFSLLDIMFILPWERALSLQEEGGPELPGEARRSHSAPCCPLEGVHASPVGRLREVGPQTLGTALCMLATSS